VREELASALKEIGGVMKILLATDGSKFSEAATQAVASQINAKDTQVLILQAVEPLVFATPPQMAPGYAPELAAKREEQFNEAKASVAATTKVLQAAGFAVSTRVVEADARTAILDIAEESNTDLIVVGSHGRRGVKKFLLGSVAESVARHARCSVLIVRMAGR
jgi:nucleotide-binding universal stress UspA family protein